MPGPRVDVDEFLDRDFSWTPRQREVLTLLARGRTNPEIATELGVTIDGAKYHVREVMSKLGVDTREEAAAYWRIHASLRQRLRRRMRGAVSTRWLLPIGIGIAAAGIAVIVGVAVVLPGRTQWGSVAPTPGGHLGSSATAVLSEGEIVAFTCDRSAPWVRPTADHMRAVFTNPRFGDGQLPSPANYTYYLSSFLYLAVPLANSASNQVTALSGLGGGDDAQAEAPSLCPVTPLSGTATQVQSLYLFNYRPVEMRHLGDHAVLVVQPDPFMLHQITFERAGPLDPKGLVPSWDPLEIVDAAGTAKYGEGIGYRWEAGESGILAFALLQGGADASLALEATMFDTTIAAYSSADSQYSNILDTDVLSIEQSGTTKVLQLSATTQQGVVLLPEGLRPR